MNIPEVIQVTSSLLALKEFHAEKADFYNKLFNAHQDGSKTDYSPLQRYYQRMTQWHLNRVFDTELQLLEFQELADMAGE
jgi:hypothetical protein